VVDGLERRAVVHVGAGAAGRDAPVVVMFHGTSGSGLTAYGNSGWQARAEADGFIAVFPSSLNWCFKEDENGDGDFDDPGEPRIATKWTAGQGGLGREDNFPLCTDAELAQFPADRQALADHPVVDDVAFVDALVAMVRAEYRVDSRRIYATGFSNGASFTARLVAERSELFAAAAVGSGKLAVPPVLATRRMSALQWVGTKDPKFIPPGLNVQVSASMLTDYPNLEASFVDALRVTLGLGGTPTYAERNVNGFKVGTFTYAQSTVGDSNTFAFSFVQDMPHAYPDGPALVMADYAWKFFETQALP
jgi:polyhydroxybutyrate depolymerase